MSAEPFGITIACCPSDFRLAEGTLESVRYFYGDVPVCLIVDGKVDLSRFRKDSCLMVLDKWAVKDPFLREKNFIPGFSKILSFWEVPFEKFLYMDSDCGAWGDLRGRLDFANHDVIVPFAKTDYPDSEISFHWFDVERMKLMDPDYVIGGQSYFCDGTFAGKVGSIPLDEYKRIYSMMEKNPGAFKFWDQGFVNYMIFRNEQAGNLRVGRESYQIIVHEYEKRDFQKRFNLRTMKNVASGGACVIHWAGYTKAYTCNPNYSPEVITFFRREFMRKYGWVPRCLEGGWFLWTDFWAWAFPYLKIKWKRRWNKACRILGFRKDREWIF